MPGIPDIPGKGLVNGAGRHAGKVAAGAGLAVIAVGGYLVRHLLRRSGVGSGAASADAISEPPTPEAVAAAEGDAATAEPIEPADAPDAPAPSREEPPAPEESPATDGPPASDAAPAPEESPATEAIADAAPAGEQPPPPPAESAKAAETEPPESEAPESEAPETGPPESETEASETGPPEIETEAAEAEARTEIPSTPMGTDAPKKPEVEPGDISKHKSPHHALNNPVEDPDPTEWPDPFEKRNDPRDPPDPDAEPFGEEPHPPTNAKSTSEPHPDEDPEAGDLVQPPKRDKLDD